LESLCILFPIFHHFESCICIILISVILATIAAVINAIAPVIIILAFAITITAATAKVTAFIVVIAATAFVAHAQHVVRAKPPNEQTRFYTTP
jgi:hypothetical protein